MTCVSDCNLLLSVKNSVGSRKRCRRDKILHGTAHIVCDRLSQANSDKRRWIEFCTDVGHGCRISSTIQNNYLGLYAARYQLRISEWKDEVDNELRTSLLKPSTPMPDGSN